MTEGDGGVVEVPGFQAAPFTVGRLRAELVGWPDETPVAVLAQRSFDGSSWASLDIIAAGSDSLDSPDGVGWGSVFPLVAALPGTEGGDGRAPWRHLSTVCVVGTPASYSTAAEKPWREAVRAAVAEAIPTPGSGAFAVRLDFRTARPQRKGESWDLDNLAKCTIDALEGALGERTWKGRVRLPTTSSSICRRRSVRSLVTSPRAPRSRSGRGSLATPEPAASRGGGRRPLSALAGMIDV